MIPKSFLTLAILVVVYIQTTNSTGTCPCAAPTSSPTCNPPTIPTDPSTDPRLQLLCFESTTVYSSVVSTLDDMEPHLKNTGSQFHNYVVADDPFPCVGGPVGYSVYKNACKRWELIKDFRLVASCTGCKDCKNCDNRRCVCDPVEQQVRLANNGRVAANLICKKQNGFYDTKTRETDLYILPDLKCCDPLKDQQNTWVKNPSCCVERQFD